MKKVTLSFSTTPEIAEWYKQQAEREGMKASPFITQALAHMREIKIAEQNHRLSHLPTL